MEVENPKYLLYFDLNSYQEHEFPTIRKLVINIMNVRYYFLDIEVKFNQEIIDYDIIKKDLSDNVMLLIGQIDDNLADDVAYEINSLLGTDRVIRKCNVHNFNSTGYSDEQLIEMYNEYLSKSQNIQYEEEVYDEKFNNLLQDFSFVNIPYLTPVDYLSICNLLIKNSHNLNSFEFLQDNNVCEALFTNFPYFLKYIGSLDLKALVEYYQKDTIKILRYLRQFVNDSDKSNDNIKEILLYKYILSLINIKQFYYDPEEGFNQIREAIDKVIEKRKDEIINAFDQKVKLFKDNYEILSVGDKETRTFKAYQNISIHLKKHFEELKPLLKSFRGIIDSSVKFNSKLNNLERNKKTLDRLVKYRLVKNYTEKYGIYTINIESGEHIPFLQGKWFEYYTASVCEDIIENYRSQGYYPDYGIYQNVMVQINGVKRELDNIIYLNGNVFYIENKIDTKNTYKNDIFKYMENVENMNVTPNNCFLVYLEGEDKPNVRIKICSITSFISRFKKEALKILEEDKVRYLEAKKVQEQADRAALEIAKLIDKEKNSLCLRYHFDEEAEVAKFKKILEKYENEANRLINISKESFFDDLETYIRKLKDESLLDKYYKFKDKYQEQYLKTIKNEDVDKELLKDMIRSLEKFKLAETSFLEGLYCLSDNVGAFFRIDSRSFYLKLKILCAYGNNITHYMDIVSPFLSNSLLITNNDAHYLFIAFLNRLNKKKIVPTNLDELGNLAVTYNDNVHTILKNEIKNSVDNYFISHKEKEFIAVLSYTLTMIHIGHFDLQGLKIDNYIEFLFRMKGNNEWHQIVLKYYDYGKILEPFAPSKYYFFELVYADAANYIFLNYEKLEEDIKKMIACDENLIFTVSRTEQTGKMLKLLEGCEVITGYKEIKKANVFVGIFKNKYMYQWFKGYYWVGVAISFDNFEMHYLVNLELKINNQNIRILNFVPEKKEIKLCLGKFINDKFERTIVKTTKKELPLTLMSLTDKDFKETK